MDKNSNVVAPLDKHPETWVKVNARVDVGVAALVKALSAWPMIETIESCQGDVDRGPWVCFTVGETWQEVSTFVLGLLGPALADKIGDCATLSLVVKESGRIQAEITVRPDGIQKTIRALRILKRELRIIYPRP